MDEKRSKRISKHKNQRRKKPAFVAPPNDRRLPRVPPAAAPVPSKTVHHPPPPLAPREEPFFSQSPDSSLNNVFMESGRPSRLTLAVHPVKFQDAIAKVDANFDFGQTQLSHARPVNLEVPTFQADFMLGCDLLDQDGRQDSQANENSFLMDSILKVNRSHRSIDSHLERLNTSNSRLQHPRFIRMTSGRRSPAPLMVLEELGDSSANIQWPNDPLGFQGVAESLNGSRALFQTLPAPNDFSYDTLPFADRSRTEGLFLKIADGTAAVRPRPNEDDARNAT